MRLNSFITTSWDDGSPHDLRVAELLTRYGLPGTFYVPRRSEHGVMEPGEIKRLGTSFELGGHTMDHLPLTRLPSGRAQRQIRDCKAWIQDMTGRPCTMFCPPLGRYANCHLPMIREAGFVGMRTVELLSADMPRLCGGLAVLPTTVQVFDHRRVAYTRNIGRRLAMRNAWLYFAAGAHAQWDRLASAIAAMVIRSGGVLHLWGHSWEIGSEDQWRRLEEVLRMLASLADAALLVSNGRLVEHASGAGSNALADHDVARPPVLAPSGQF